MKKLLLVLVFLAGFAGSAVGVYYLFSKEGTTEVKILSKAVEVKMGKLPKIGNKEEKSGANKIAVTGPGTFLIDSHNTPVTSGQKWELKKIPLATAKIKNLSGEVMYEVSYTLEVDLHEEGGVLSFALLQEANSRPNYLFHWRSYLEVKALGSAKKRKKSLYKDYQVDLYLFREGDTQARHVTHKIRVGSDGSSSAISSK